MKKKEEILGKFVGYCIAIPFIALFLLWYNHVIVQWNIKYWQWLILAIPLVWFRHNNKWFSVVISILWLITFVGQLLYWMNIITLPLIKL